MRTKGRLPPIRFAVLPFYRIEYARDGVRTAHASTMRTTSVLPFWGFRVCFCGRGVSSRARESGTVPDDGWQRVLRGWHWRL